MDSDSDDTLFVLTREELHGAALKAVDEYYASQKRFTKIVKRVILQDSALSTKDFKPNCLLVASDLVIELKEENKKTN